MDDVVTFEVLGPVRAMVGSGDRAPDGERPRRLLAMLVLHGGAVVGDDALCEAVWPGKLPADHRSALQTQVYRLRRALPGGSIVRAGGGYRLDAEPDRIDAVRFERRVQAAIAHRDQDPLAALDELDEALGLWRGTPYEDLADVDDAAIDASRLEDLRVRATEERYECLLRAERTGDVLAELAAFAARHPLRERPQAQLMRLLHREGRLADALATYDRYRRGLAEELGIDPSPAITALHDEIVRGSPTAAHPPGRGPGVHAAVPVHSSSFIGREAALSELEELVGRHRSVTLLGTGGVGKTRLAAEVVARIRPRFADGVWFCALADAAPGGVALAVAARLGIEQRSGTDPAERIADVLAHQRALLVLDNCEHVLDDAAALVEAIILRAPTMAVLATSRERLNVDGEHLFPVAPLPEPGEPPGIDQPAVALFVDRARAVRPDWQPAGESIAKVAAACRRLSGLPLAIELAAARMQTHTIDEVLEGLDAQARFLVGGRRTVDRHRSLAAAVAWSHELLTEEQRTVFEAVSVFQAPFTVDGAAAVSGRTGATAAERLSELVGCSVLHRTGDRYGVLEPLRAFGRERLRERGALGAVGRDHATHLRDRLIASAHLLRMPSSTDVLREVERDLADAEVAFRTFVDADDAELALDVVGSLFDVGLHRMRHEVLAWAEVAAVLAIEVGCPAHRIADAHATAAFGAWKRGDFARYQELTEESLRWSHRAGVPATARTADALSTYALVNGQLADARRWTSMAHDLWTAAGDRLHAAEAQGVHLLAIAYSGEDAGAAAESMLRRLGDEASVLEAAFTWYTAGEVLVDRQPDVALERLRRAVELSATCGSRFIQGIAGSSVASLEARWGEPRAAIATYRWLLPHWQRAGVHSLAWTTLRSVVELLARVGADHDAAVLLGAVTSTAAGHEVFGADAHRLEAVAAVLQDRLGGAAFDAARRRGATFDDGQGAAFASAAFDRL